MLRHAVRAGALVLAMVTAAPAMETAVDVPPLDDGILAVAETPVAIVGEPVFYEGFTSVVWREPGVFEEDYSSLAWTSNHVNVTLEDMLALGYTLSEPQDFQPSALPLFASPLGAV